MSDDKGVSPLSIISLVLGFVTAPTIFCCVGYVTGLLGIVVGLIGLFAKKSVANRVTAGFGLGINGIAVGGYTVLFMITAATSDMSQPQATERPRAPVSSPAATSTPASAPAPAVDKLAGLPATERAFCEALEGYAEVYRAADNDLKRSKARTDRGDALRAAVPRANVEGWTGTVKTITTTSEGNVVLELRLPCRKFGVGTWNNEFSDIMDGTLIPRDSPLYGPLAELSVGDTITFSGTLIPDERDGFRETSLTEFGSMTGGYFLVRF